MASAKVLASLSLQLDANTAELKKDLAAARADVQKYGNSIANVSKTIKQSWANIAGAFNVVQQSMDLVKGGLNQLKSGFNATSAGADELSKKTDMVNASVIALNKSIVTGDFENIAINIKRAMIAARDFADEMNLQDQRTSDLTLLKTKLDAQIKGLKLLQTEGTISKKQTDELEILNKDLYDLEIDILNAKSDAYIKQAATRLGVDEKLFKGLQEGVYKRARLSEDELKNLEKFPEEYKRAIEKIQDSNRTTDYVTAGQGTEWQTTTAVNGFDYAKIKQETEALFNSLTETQKLQVFEDLMASPEEWSQLIGYWGELNNMMGEYNKNANLIQKGENKVKDGPAPILFDLSDEPKRNSFDPFANVDWELPEEVFFNDMKLDEMLDQQQEKVNELANTYKYFGDSIASSLSQGANSWAEYGDSVKNAIVDMILASTAMIITNAILSSMNAALAAGPYGLIILPALIALGVGIAKTAINQIPGFETGGIVGGNSFTGDQVPAYVNSGEMILTRSQQSNLFKSLNGTSGGAWETANVTIGFDSLQVALQRINKRNRII